MYTALLVCILSISDLYILTYRPKMFANKFYADYYYGLSIKVRKETLGNARFHNEYYNGLELVKHHIA